MTEEQANEQQPYLGQRCHVEGKDFGTIVALKDDLEKKLARVELDARGSQRFEVEKLELLPTYPAS
jgi:hypothetical protein